MEFLAVVLSILTSAQLGVRNASIRLCGDSRTFLAWGVDGHFKGIISQRTSLVYILGSLMFDIVASEAVHIPAAENDLCDRLSRQRPTGSDPTLIVDFSSESPSTRVLLLCDPTREAPFSNETSLRDFWMSTQSLSKKSHASNLCYPVPCASHVSSLRLLLVHSLLSSHIYFPLRVTLPLFCLSHSYSVSLCTTHLGDDIVEAAWTHVCPKTKSWTQSSLRAGSLKRYDNNLKPWTDFLTYHHIPTLQHQDLAPKNLSRLLVWFMYHLAVDLEMPEGKIDTTLQALQHELRLDGHSIEVFTTATVKLARRAYRDDPRVKNAPRSANRKLPVTFDMI